MQSANSDIPQQGFIASSHQLSLVACVFSLLVIAVGSLVMLGWMLNYPPITTLKISLAPMQFNTALGLVMLGTSLYSLIKHLQLVFVVSTASLLLLGSVTLGQYLFSLDFGIDQLLFKVTTSDNSPFPGRMAINTAMCFLLSAVALIARFHAFPQHQFISRFCVSTVFLISMLALLGYVAGLDNTIGWYGWSFMAVHTALGFLGFVVAYAAYAMSHKRQWNSIPIYWVTGLGIVLPFLFFLTLWQKNVSDAFIQQQNVAKEHSALLATQLNNRTEAKVNALIRMRDRWNGQDYPSIDAWKRDAKNYLKHQTDLVYLAVIDDNYNILHQASLLDEHQDNISLKHLQTRPGSLTDLHISKAYLGNNNNQYTQIFLPFEGQKNAILGIVGVYNLRTSVSNLLPDKLDRKISILFNDTLIFSSEDTPLSVKNWSHQSTFNIFDSTWTVQTDIPNPAIGKISNWSFISGALLSLTFGLLIFFYFSSVKRSYTIAAAEKRFRSVLESTVDAVIIINEKGKIQQINPAVSSMFGYSDKDLIGKNIKKLMPTSTAEEHDNYLSHYVTSGKGSIIGNVREVEAQHKDKSLIPIELSISEFSVDGKRFFSGFLRNISQRKVTEAKLIESETRYDLAIQGSVVGIWDWYDVSSSELFWSDTFLALLGYSPGELDVDIDTFGDRLHPEDRAKTWDAVNAHFKDKVPYDTEFRLLCKDGSYRWFRGTGKATFDEEGKPVRMVGSVADIQSRKELEDRQARLVDILENSTDYIGQIDANKRVIFLNRAFRELSGKNDINAVDINDWHSKEAQEKLKNVIFPETVKHGVWQGTLDLIDKNGRLFPVSMVHIAHKDWRGDIAYFSAIFRDISIQKQNEQELIALKEAAERANSTKGNFLANMSHEIRTPMNGIIGLTNLALKLDLDDKPKEYLGKIKYASQSLLNILNDILDYSKIEAGKLDIIEKEFDLEKLLLNTAGIFTIQAADKQIEFLIDNHCEHRLLRGDELRIGQVIQNLIGNAIKFTERGIVKLLVVDEELDNNRISLSFTISDTGIGMTPEQINNLFSAFSQADGTITRKYGGTGLGLTICQRLVQMMDGRLDVISMPNEGSTFAFNIVVKNTELDEKRHKPEKKFRTLVVDDNPVSLSVFENLLTTWEYDFELTDSPIQALALLEKACLNGELYDLLIVDWKMPTLDGLQLIEIIQNDSRFRLLSESLSVLMVTGFGHELIEQGNRSKLPDVIIEKPVLASRLYDAIADSRSKKNEKSRLPHTIKKALPDKHALSGCKILLVEDNKTNQLVATDFLKQLDIHVFIAENGQDGVEFCKTHDVDLILMDIQMPVMDGIQATQLIRKLPNGNLIPIIAMSAAAMAQDKEKCFAAGMNEHLAKPVNFEQLESTLIKYLCSPKTEAQIQKETENKPEEQARQLMTFPNEPGFEFEQAFERLSQSEKLLIKVIEQFSLEIPKYVDGIDAALNDGNQDEMKRIIHTLKSASATVGADKLSRLCRDSEVATKQGQVVNYQEIKDELTRVSEVLNNLLISSEQSTRSNIDANIDAVTLMESLFEDLKSGKFILDERLNNDMAVLKKHIKPQEAVDNLHDSIERMDFNSAMQKLESMISNATR